MPLRHLARTLSAIAGAMLLLASSLAGAAAQGAESTATPTLDEPERGLAYPVSIHEGTCDDPEALPVGPAIESGVAGWQPGAEVTGITTQQPVLVAEADYDGTIEHFTESSHVIAIHESSENYGNIVACGEIAGYVDDGTLAIPMRSEGNSLISGVAIISDNTTFIEEALDLIDESLTFDHDSINLTVYIVPGDAS